MEAQREIDGSWTTVFTPYCASNDVKTFASGESLVVPISVFGYTVPGKEPKLDPRMVPGRYRVRFGVGVADASTLTGSHLLGHVQASTPFVVTQ